VLKNSKLFIYINNEEQRSKMVAAMHSGMAVDHVRHKIIKPDLLKRKGPEALQNGSKSHPTRNHQA
jgi:hypothetical protein